MFKKLYPYEYVESIFCINYQKLLNKGYNSIIYDIDNTLVPHGKGSTYEVEQLFKYLHKIGFKTLLLSNNCDERIKEFNKNINTLYICDAEKPKKHNYLKAINMLNTDKKSTIYIGDQVFTDIFGANRSGIDNILVKYIGFLTETKIGIKRNLEKVILKLYRRNKSYQNRLGNIQLTKEELFDVMEER